MERYFNMYFLYVLLTGYVALIEGRNNTAAFHGDKDKTLQISCCDCRCDRIEVIRPKLDAVLQQTLKTDYSLLIQIKAPYTDIPIGFSTNKFLF